MLHCSVSLREKDTLLFGVQLWQFFAPFSGSAPGSFCTFCTFLCNSFLLNIIANLIILMFIPVKVTFCALFVHQMNEWTYRWSAANNQWLDSNTVVSDANDCRATRGSIIKLQKISLTMFAMWPTKHQRQPQCSSTHTQLKTPLASDTATLDSNCVVFFPPAFSRAFLIRPNYNMSI